MNSKLRIFGIGLVHAAIAAAYVILIATLLPKLAPAGEDTPLTGAAFLMVFSASAAVMASLVFLKPVLWYIEGKKKEAMYLLGSIIACLFVAAALVLALIR